jgi:hypothetical protein
MPERPNLDLGQFTRGIERSSEHHRSVIAPQTNEVHREHAQGRMTSQERQASVDRAAAELRRAVDGA